MKNAELCARFHEAIELIGRRWTGAIIQVLFRKPARFAELRSAIPGITDRMLSERLRELEAEGVVRRSVAGSVPVRVAYELSPKGRDLERALMAIGSWARQWIPGSRNGVRGSVSARRRRPLASRSRLGRRSPNSRG